MTCVDVPDADGVTIEKATMWSREWQNWRTNRRGTGRVRERLRHRNKVNVGERPFDPTVTRAARQSAGW